MRARTASRPKKGLAAVAARPEQLFQTSRRGYRRLTSRRRTHQTVAVGSGGDDAGPLSTGTALLGLLAGLVAGLYVLGGLALALRLLFGGFSLGLIVGLLGDLSEPFMVTTGLVSVIAPASVVGIGALAWFAFDDGPRARGEAQRSLRASSAGWPRILYVLAAVATALVGPPIYVAIENHGLSPWLATALVGLVVTYLFTALGWVRLRELSLSQWSRSLKAIAGAGVWTAMALTPAIMFAAALDFERAIVCTTDTQVPQSGLLIAETDDRVLLVRSDSKGTEKAISVPRARVTQLEYGDVDRNPQCSA